MERFRTTWRKTPRTLRRSVVSVVGFILIIAGVIMLAVPGPGWATIFLGLAVLATEFDRAKVIRDKLVARFKKTVSDLKRPPKH